MIVSCWSGDPKQRPEFAILSKSIQAENMAVQLSSTAPQTANINDFIIPTTISPQPARKKNSCITYLQSRKKRKIVIFYCLFSILLLSGLIVVVTIFASSSKDNVSNPSPTNPSISIICNAGFYSESTNCIQCLGGSYSTTGSRSCTQCLAGSYSSSGSSSCTLCPAGKYSFDGYASCLSCAGGSYSIAGSSLCNECASGSYSIMGASNCTACPSGHYSLKGYSECLACPAGTVSNSNATKCVSCNAGFYSNVGSSSCIPCATGYNSSTGSSGCHQCASGYYSDGFYGCFPPSYVTFIAGDGQYAFYDGQGHSASLNMPLRITIDSVGNLYITDSGNHRIRKINSTGYVYFCRRWTTFI
jgi:hypothetical protein